MAAPVFNLAACNAFAQEQHSGQVDKMDRDYYQHHLLPVAAKVKHLGEHAIMAALLHDYIEDIHHGDIPAGVDVLRERGVPEPVIAAVCSVTRITFPDGHKEPYADLIARSCDDALGVHIKLADNEVNIANNPALSALDPAKGKSLLTKRYLPARDALIIARTLHSLGIYSPESSPRLQPWDS